MQRARSENTVLAILLAGLLAGGCGEAAYTRRAPLAGGPANQGESWEVVLPGGQVAAAEAPGDEALRRDWVLASPPLSELPADAWAEPYRPGLERTRRLFISNRASEVLYLGTEYPPVWGGYRWWWH